MIFSILERRTRQNALTNLEKKYICSLKNNTHIMKKVTLVALVALALSSCNSDPKFNVKGDVSGADGKCFIWKLPDLKELCLWIL